MKIIADSKFRGPDKKRARQWLVNGVLLTMAGAGTIAATVTTGHADTNTSQAAGTETPSSAATSVPQSVVLSAGSVASNQSASAATNSNSESKNSDQSIPSQAKSVSQETQSSSANVEQQSTDSSADAQNQAGTIQKVTVQTAVNVDSTSASANTQATMRAARADIAVSTAASEAVQAPSENAAIWMPDATLRAFAESQANHEFGAVVNDDNLYQYIGRIQNLTSPESANNGIKSLAGLEYAQTLQTLQLYNSELGSDGMVDLSNLAKLNLISIFNDQTLTGTVDEFINKHLGADNDLWTIQLVNDSLSGTIPDLHNFLKLRTLILAEDNLTGTIPDLSYLPNLLVVQFFNNQLTGGLDGLINCSNVFDIRVQNNDLSGELPDLSGLDLSTRFDFRYNHFTSSATGLQKNAGWTYGVGQGVQAGTYQIGKGTNGFDPITGYLFGATDYSNGVTPVADYHYTVRNWTTTVAGTYVYRVENGKLTDVSNAFDIVADPNDPSGFKLVPNTDLPDGSYMVYVTGSDIAPKVTPAAGYSAFLYFNLVNVKPTDPDNLGQPDNPDNPDNPDQPENPGNPDQPDDPNEPDQPEKPQIPDKPDVPQTPENPDTNETTTPENSAASQQSNETFDVVTSANNEQTASATNDSLAGSAVASVAKAAAVQSSVTPSHANPSQHLEQSKTDQRHELPATSQQSSSIWTAIGLSILSLMSFGSLTGGYRRRH
ncbi:hypothetical protein [Furfurilactobacillus rossiae]|uniref:Gram-positive cocci surface proteins LPxTG domain-containing protein n=1 Tax=Furfurilactobacillus rossiae DSM 15814 TaxID=1114972 RepID=A0A0R1RAG3_9LACO|nr:hypothetical protein [Furfurilactobacillus rossiae]KRL53708.1 hypothetical protein FD35_GL000960 [Furfurilactobacillus rossiae DSM 15814]QFR67700.1 hypothetical protein LR814_11545 [Furfurilactobacillus rossiae]QLE60666.1 Glutamyl endopeptidase precursor [Furfurilactobacillus rossiae]